MRSTVPLPCFFDESQRVAGQRPQQGMKSCRMGRNCVRPYIRMSIHPPSSWPSNPSSRPSDPSSWPSEGGQTDGRMGKWADRQTEFLPILQDFLPCWGCCPATLCNFTTSTKQGKGTADLMMPFGVLFVILFHIASSCRG